VVEVIEQSFLPLRVDCSEITPGRGEKINIFGVLLTTTMVPMSITTLGERMSHQYQYLEDAATRLLDKVNREKYNTRGFAQEHAALLKDANVFLDNMLTWIKSRHAVTRENHYFRLVDDFLLEICDLPTDTVGRVIITVKEDSTCVSMYNSLPMMDLPNHPMQFGFMHGGQRSMDQYDWLEDFHNAAGQSVLFVTDRYASQVVNEALHMNNGPSVVVLNYDTNGHGPANLLQQSSDRIQRGIYQRDLNRITARYKELKFRFEQLQKKERMTLHAELERQRITVSAVTTIARWWRRSQLALKQQATIVIQRHLRTALCRIHAKRAQIAAAERVSAAKSIQIWRRNIVLQRKNRKLDAAALSNPLRERGLPLPPRSRTTLRRHKRRERGRHKYLSTNEGEPELHEPLQELRQSVQCLQESVNKLEERNQQLVDTNAQLLQELRVIRSLLSSSNNGTKIESALHTPSELSCGGNVIGKSIHNSCVSGSSRRESVLDNSHRHGGENLHPHDATITQDVIGAALPSRSSGSESVLENSPPTPSSSSRGKSSRRRRRRRRHRSKRWKWNKRTLSNKGTALAISHIPTPNHRVSQPDLLPMSTFRDKLKLQSIDSQTIHPFAIDCNTNKSSQPTAVNSKSSRSASRSFSLDENHSTSSTSISSSPSTSPEMTSSSVMSSNPMTSELETPIVLNKLQPSSSTPIVDNSPSSTTTLVELTPSMSITTEEEPSICHVKPASYLSALIGTATNIG